MIDFFFLTLMKIYTKYFDQIPGCYISRATTNTFFAYPASVGILSTEKYQGEVGSMYVYV